MSRMRTAAAVAATGLVLAGCAGSSARDSRHPQGATLWDDTRFEAFAKVTPPPPPPPGKPLVPRAKNRKPCEHPGPGDINGDGYADAVVGESLGESEPGGVRVLYGTPDGLTATKQGRAPDDQAFNQDTPGVPGVLTEWTSDQFGIALAVADFDGDGCADVAVGAPRGGGAPYPARDDANDYAGFVHVLYGTPRGLSTAGLTVVRQPSPTPPDAATVEVPEVRERGDAFGSELAAGDFDGDGYADLAVVAENDRPGPNTVYKKLPASCYGGHLDCRSPHVPLPDLGTVTVVYGSPDGLGRGARVPRTVTHLDLGGTPGDDYLFGRALTTGDFDGDRVDDLVIAAPAKLPKDGAYGVVHVLPGRRGAGLDPAAARTFGRATPGVPGDGRDELFGNALAAGDLDADGRDDLAIGTYGGSILVLYAGGGGLATAGARELTPSDVPLLTDGSVNAHALTIGQFGGPGAAEDLAIGDGRVVVLFGRMGGLSATGARLAGRGGDTLAAHPVRGTAYDDLLIGVPYGGRGGSLLEVPTGPRGPRPADARRWRPDSPGMADQPGHDGGMGREIG